MGRWRNGQSLTPITGDGSIPTGGADGQVLTKASGTDYDAEWEDAPYANYLYNSSGAQTGNRFNDWDDLVAAMALVAGPKTVTFEQNETLPAGAYNFDYIKFVGNSSPVGGGAIIVTFPTGVTVTSMIGTTIVSGMTFHSTSTAAIMTVPGSLILPVDFNSGITSASKEFFFVENTSTLFVLGLRDGAVVGGAGTYGYEVVNVEAGFAGTCGVSLAGVSPTVENDSFRSSATTMLRLVQGVVVDLTVGATQTNMGGGVFDVFFTYADTLSYDNTASGLTATEVQAAIDEHSSGNTNAYTPTNVVTDRAYDANATTVAELADVLGTVIADLQTAGILG